VKKAFDAAAVDAALGSRHNRPSSVAANAIAIQGDTFQVNNTVSPPPFPPLPQQIQPPRAGERRIIDSLPPIEMVHALFRKTKMGSFFNNPIDPPEFLSLAFPLPEDLRCVSKSERTF
jgi:hypothetical protein